MNCKLRNFAFAINAGTSSLPDERSKPIRMAVGYPPGDASPNVLGTPDVRAQFAHLSPDLIRLTDSAARTFIDKDEAKWTVARVLPAKLV